MSDIHKELEPTHDQIQKRAYQLYLARGEEHGQDLEDWLFAEEQLQRENGERVSRKQTPLWNRAAEEIKDSTESSESKRTKTVAAGQQRTK